MAHLGRVHDGAFSRCAAALGLLGVQSETRAHDKTEQRVSEHCNAQARGEEEATVARVAIPGLDCAIMGSSGTMMTR